MFESLVEPTPDAILGLTEAFKKDSNPEKINLSVGVYKDSKGVTPIFRAVKEAEKRLTDLEKSKGYLPINGSEEYGNAVQALLFGEGHEIVSSSRAATAHTPGGTGGLRVAADFLVRMYPGKKIWISDPTWANHPNIFQAAGLEIETYPYFDASKNDLDFDSMIQALGQIPEGDAVLLHGCCHNPTGIDPSVEQWKEIAKVVGERGLLPLVDFAYQGLADGLTEDAVGFLNLCQPGRELLIASSFSKNFGLYNERVGAMTLVGATAEAAAAAFSHVEKAIRSNYSNPPSHGGAIVATILNDAALRKDWESEVAEMRVRINGMRTLFVKTLADKGVDRDFGFITRQRGMFSFSGLTKDQVERLKKEYAIYIVGSGRINVAGMTEDNMGRLCDAIKTVL
ncbi:MAG: aspartate/tyrosine/aromatic aminotransferase [Candidatus Omnitrophica bacterium]|nr:aspartate/tyrosine/aromatic aminotransferase [Candidatus Omnitrophota bacterium]